MIDLQQTAASFWADHPPDPTWVAHYASSVGLPHRAVVVGALRRLSPWSSLWEVGCHCGPMLWAVQEAFPEARLGGCDVNPEAVDYARQCWPGVRCGAFPAVSAALPDGLADVVLSCYTLAYIAPDDLMAALGEMARLARRAVVVCEPVSWAGQTGVRQGGRFCEWQHPYMHRLMRHEAYQGWSASCEALAYDTNHLSGLIVVERP